jgi:divalent metal cation (Fe/Co/Zn/Cd) transporter
VRKPGVPALHRRIFRLTVATISWNLVEAAVALTGGIMAGSVALTGFGLDSMIEFASALFILWKLGGGREAESRENTARRGISLTFLALGGWIAWESSSSLLSNRHPETSTTGIILAAVSLAVMPLLGRAKMRAGRALKSRAVQADAM